MLQEYLYTVKNKTINVVIAFICVEFFTSVCTVTACGQKYLRNFIQARHIQAEVNFEDLDYVQYLYVSPASSLLQLKRKDLTSHSTTFI